MSKGQSNNSNVISGLPSNKLINNVYLEFTYCYSTTTTTATATATTTATTNTITITAAATAATTATTATTATATATTTTNYYYYCYYYYYSGRIRDRARNNTPSISVQHNVCCLMPTISCNAVNVSQWSSSPGWTRQSQGNYIRYYLILGAKTMTSKTCSNPFLLSFIAATGATAAAATPACCQQTAAAATTSHHHPGDCPAGGDCSWNYCPGKLPSQSILISS